MRAFQLFQTISPQLAAGVFRDLRETNRDVYKGALISLANERKLRPVFVQRKPLEAQIDWLVKTVKLKSSDSAAEHILQVWLLKAHKDLLVAFLDAIGLAHDGDGTVEELPDDLESAKVGPAIDQLLESWPAELVATYLWVFQMQKPGGWPPLTVKLHEDARLRLGAAPAPAPADPAPSPVVQAAPTEAEAESEVASAAEAEEA